MRPVRWGILGTGDINRRFLAHVHEAPSAEIIAVGSRSDDRAAEFAARFGIERAHGSYEALLQDESIEAVYICVPNRLHHEWTMQALAEGKHVLCEKPYSRHPSEVAEAFDAAAAAGLCLMEGFMWRHTPQAQRFVELLPEVGDLRTIRATFSFGLFGPGDVHSQDELVDIRLRPDLDGGCLMDVGCYCVSGARLAAGSEPQRVHGEQVLGPSGVDVQFAAILRFPGDVTASMAAGFTSRHATLEAIGSDGSLLLPDPWTGMSPGLWLDGRKIAVEPQDPYRLEIENISAAIRGEAAPLLGRADALGQARAIAALCQSAQTGEAVTLGAS